VFEVLLGCSLGIGGVRVHLFVCNLFVGVLGCILFLYFLSLELLIGDFSDCVCTVNF
jgi:hypothetical protein